MKIFYKYLTLALLISIVPLIIFSMILINTTGKTLKTVIDRNNINLFENINREVNKFFLDLNSRMDIARKIERSPGLSKAAKSEILYNAVSANPEFLGLFLLDSSFKPITGMTSDDRYANIPPARELVEKARRTSEIAIGSINQQKKFSPYFDIVYPLETDPAEFLCYRVKLEFIFNKIQPYLKADPLKIQKNIWLIDHSANAASIRENTVKKIPEQQLLSLKKAIPNVIFTEMNRIIITDYTIGPKWLVFFEEPAAEAYSAIRRMMIIAGLLIIFTTCLAVFGALQFARGLTRPIESLIKGISVVANGDLTHKVPKVSNDELSKLGDQFNLMTVKLQKLQEDIKKSERLSAIGQMANILGHEIRSPLSAITNCIYLIKTDKNLETGSKIFKRIEIMESAMQSTDKIINDMLDFSRTRAPVLVKKDFNKLLSEVVEEIKIPEKIKLDFFPGEIPETLIDVEEMKQVLRNLINNAVDSMDGMPSGTLLLRTNKEQFSRNKVLAEGVVLEIKDDGCGIPQENLNKIFDPFFSTKSKGTGLGLAVVRKIVQERHRGVIEVHSKKDKGTSC